MFPADLDGRPVAVKRAAQRTGHAVARWCGSLVAQGVPVVAPVAGPAWTGDRDWVVYPWIEGRAHNATMADGDLVGRVLGANSGNEGMAQFPWPQYEPDEPLEDLPALRELFTRHAAADASRLTERLAALAKNFTRQTLPAVRDADLPMDFRVNNLVCTESGPVLIDPDKGMRAPGILDLAIAVLLFHNEQDGAPPGLFTRAEWLVFRDAYLRHVEPTSDELRAWPDVLDHVLWEEGAWAIAESTEWSVPRQRAFLLDLAGTANDAYPLP